MKQQALLPLLDLEQIEHNIFRGFNRDIGSGRVYGGQALAQALVAAARTVEPDRWVHSVHCYFILPGDVKAPIIYDVARLRDGRSFTTRSIVAIQHGRAIFNLAASFHIDEPGAAHQIDMPDVPPPDDLPRDLDMIRAKAHLIPERIRPIFTQERPIDFRPVDPVDPFNPEKRPPIQYLWIRALEPMPDDPLIHQAVLAYASDYGLLRTALYPHQLSLMQPNFQAASLDHAMWFHRKVRADEWLLYAIDSPVAAGARGFTRGSIFTQDGVLVASTAQEGLMRVRDKR